MLTVGKILSFMTAEFRPFVWLLVIVGAVVAACWGVGYLLSA
jgi:hypothetical protein